MIIFTLILYHKWHLVSSHSIWVGHQKKVSEVALLSFEAKATILAPSGGYYKLVSENVHPPVSHCQSVSCVHTEVITEITLLTLSQIRHVIIHTQPSGTEQFIARTTTRRPKRNPTLSLEFDMVKSTFLYIYKDYSMWHFKKSHTYRRLGWLLHEVFSLSRHRAGRGLSGGPSFPPEAWSWWCSSPTASFRGFLDANTLWLTPHNTRGSYPADHSGETRVHCQPKALKKFENLLTHLHRYAGTPIRSGWG